MLCDRQNFRMGSMMTSAYVISTWMGAEAATCFPPTEKGKIERIPLPESGYVFHKLLCYRRLRLSLPEKEREGSKQLWCKLLVERARELPEPLWAIDFSPTAARKWTLCPNYISSELNPEPQMNTQASWFLHYSPEKMLNRGLCCTPTPDPCELYILNVCIVLNC